MSSVIFNHFREQEVSVTNMKIIKSPFTVLILFLMSFSFVCADCSYISNENEEGIRPLFQEDRHFIYYRTIFISSAIYRIEDLISSIEGIDESILMSFKEQIKIIKYNLGEIPTKNNEILNNSPIPLRTH
jgi:hypothetical protein